MAVQTGRTQAKYFKFQIHDSGAVLRDIAVSSFGGFSVDYDQIELTALQDELKGFLPGHGTVAVEISGPWSTQAAVAASATTEKAALSGSHTVLYDLPDDQTPLAFAAYFGVRHYWEAGEPVFGISATAANGIQVFNFVLNENMTYSATLAMWPGSAAPTWGTAAIT
ncbi:MAG: hypothetical protein JRD89_14565 [Deltaproteobacteria bacterium]|nr:hypothetical protein [Deltaproteobacteria bacterium]